MLEQFKTDHILFLDIETVPQLPSYELLDESGKELWSRKAEFLKKSEMDTPASLYPRAGIYAEFGKIICISCGFFSIKGKEKHFRLKSFYGDDEKELLTGFCKLLTDHFSNKNNFLCAHNGKEFDFPFLSRRMLIHNLNLPLLLNTSGKKPWEVQHLDTMELWKFGDYKNFTPLNLLAHIFGIQSPKDDMDGSMVWFVYWKEKNLQRIVSYCQKDVLTVAQIFLRMRGEPLLDSSKVIVT